MGYFNSWRRKAGVVTLVLACLFASAWFRSWRTMDSLTLPCGTDQFLILMSGDHWIGYVVIHTSVLPVGWASNDRGNPFDWINSGEQISSMLPHAVFVIPLTLLSAWLLLSKPGKAKIRLPIHSEPSSQS